MADKQQSSPITINKLSTYANSLDPTAKQRYSTKLLYDAGTKSLPDPYAITEKWSADPSSWPDLTFGDIYLYLIDTPSIFTKESMKAYKSLEAYNYVVSGHVQVVMSHPVDETCPFIALKARVTPSQRARDKPHEPWVYLAKSDGTVYCAHCTCMAGLGEVCSHVGALLFKVEMAVKMGLNQTSSTSKACQWNNTFRKEVTPTTVTDIFQQIKGKRTKDIPTFQATGSAALPTQEVLDDLFAVAPNAAFFTSIKAQTPDSSIPTSDVAKYPQLLSLFQQDCNPDNIDQLCHEKYSAYTVTQYQADNLEAATRNQSISSLWYQHRMGRVTASKAHDILTRRATTPAATLTKRIAGYSTYDLSKKDAVKWGIDHEEECRQAYTRHQSTSHIDFSYMQSGFVIDPSHPFLGASPDGIVHCHCCGKGTLEVKCPFKHRNITVPEAAQTDKDFCLDVNLNLKTGHRYYTQVQMQMYITKTQYTDFVIYTTCKPEASMVIVRIPVDHTFCSKLVERCNIFIRDNVIRELITRELENMPNTNDTNNNAMPTQINADDRTWCLCAEPEYGRMIQCDNDQCPYVWFHYKCVNIRRKPRGKWLCLSCEQ